MKKSKKNQKDNKKSPQKYCYKLQKNGVKKVKKL